MSQYSYDGISSTEVEEPTVQSTHSLTIQELFLPQDFASSHDVGSKVIRSAWHITCLILYASSTVLHFVLIMIMHFGVEKRVQVQLGSQSETLSLVIQICLQSFAIASLLSFPSKKCYHAQLIVQVYLMAALFVTQKLFMHRLLVKRQNLTQTHDQYASWLGLGRGVTTLFKQRSVMAGYRWIILITTYLAASAVMKITTAALFQLTPTTIIMPRTTEASSITPNVLTSIMYQPVPDMPDMVGYQRGYMADNLREAMILENMRLGTWEKSPTVDSIGLHGNVLYDVLPKVVNVTGTANVTGTIVNAACNTLSTKDMLNLTAFLTGSQDPHVRVPWTPLSGSGHYIPVGDNSSLPSTFLTQFASMYGIEDTQGNTMKVIPFKKFEIRDSGGNSLPYIELRHIGEFPYSYSCPFSLGLCFDVEGREPLWRSDVAHDSGVGFMTCSISWSTSYVIVDAEQRTLVNPPKRKDHSLLSELALETLSSANSILHSVPVFESSETLGQWSFKFDCNYTSESWDEKISWNVDWTPFDFFSDQYLGLSNQSTLPRIKLHDFENMLEDWLAMNFYIYHKVNTLMKMGNIGQTSSVSVSVRVQVSQLQLRAMPVFGGFAASLIMLAIAAIIVFTTPALRSQPDEIGVLQLLWLSDLKFDLGSPLARPTEANLRRAGLSTAVSLVNGLGAFRRQGKVY